MCPQASPYIFQISRATDNHLQGHAKQVLLRAQIVTRHWHDCVLPRILRSAESAQIRFLVFEVVEWIGVGSGAMRNTIRYNSTLTSLVITSSAAIREICGSGQVAQHMLGPAKFGR